MDRSMRTPAMAAFLQNERRGLQPIEFWLEHVHLDDRPRVWGSSSARWCSPYLRRFSPRGSIWARGGQARGAADGLIARLSRRDKKETVRLWQIRYRRK